MNELLFIHKPQGMTSFALVAKVRHTLNLKKVGHAGTLDPNAEGLMIVLLGKATKALPYLRVDRKMYEAQLQLGVKTDTGDIWGKIIQEEVASPHSIQTIQQVLNSFVGEGTQIPPMVSALSHQGKRLYAYHREGIEIERPARTITIHSIKLMQYTHPFINYQVEVSSGTYVRTLCEDIAERLNTIGTLAALTRTRVGDIELKEAMTLEDLENVGPQTHPIEDHLIYPMVDYEDIEILKQGKRVEVHHESNWLVLSHQAKAVAVYRRDDDSDIYHCVRGLW